MKEKLVICSINIYKSNFNQSACEKTGVEFDAYK